jgi:hypothetical protein
MRCSLATRSLLLGFTMLSSTHVVHAQTKVPGVTPPAPDTPAGRFGLQSQIALSSDEGINTSYSSTDGTSRIIYTLRPALDYFVIDNLSLGVVAGLDYTKVEEEHASVFSIGPRLGYNVSFKSMFSIWFRLGMSYAVRDQTAGFGPDTADKHAQINASIPLMFHPLKHFFVGFGPALDADVSGDPKTTTIAGRVTIGGWF